MSLHLAVRLRVPSKFPFNGYRVLSPTCTNDWGLNLNTDYYLALELRKGAALPLWSAYLFFKLCCYFTCLIPQHTDLIKLQSKFILQKWETELRTHKWQIVDIKLRTLVRARELRTEGNTINRCEISPTRCNNCVFILRNGFYSTYFGRQSHTSSGVHMLYMATGKLAHLGCKFVSSKVVLSLWSYR